MKKHCNIHSIPEYADKMGESTNAFIQRAIEEAIARDTAK